MWPVTATEADMPAAPSDERSRLAALRARLVVPMPDDRPWGWLGPLLVTAFGAILRFDRLRVPRALIFDETYYAKDAWSILNHGVELTLAGNANSIIQAGHTNIFAPCGGTSACREYVVQPEVGKLLIAVGEWLFGLNSFGWRFASAVFGSLAILLICRIARRMTRSTLLGCIAGLLMSLDGLEFVLSRTGILDIFLMFFVLAAFGCILIDRDAGRVQLADGVARRQGGQLGPRFGIRRWRVAAGICLGLAVATKWNAAWYIIGFAALITAWDIGPRRAPRGPLAAGHVHRDPAGRLPRQLERLVRHQHRLLPGLRPEPRRAHSGDLGAVLAVGVPPAGDHLWRGAENPAPVPVAAVGLAAGHPAGRLLLRVLHRAGAGPLALLPVRLQGRGMVAGGAGARHAGDLVGLDAGAAVLPGLVAAAPGLAGRGGAARRAGRLGPVVPAGDQDQVLLLRAGVRAVPDLVHRALPGPDSRTRHGQRAAPGDRRPHRRRLRAVRTTHVLVLLFGSGRKGHPVPGLAASHVVPDRPRLDLDRRTGLAHRTGPGYPR